MRPTSAPGDDEPLEQDAESFTSTDPAVARWFLADGERRNPATDLRSFSLGNNVEPLVDGTDYFAALLRELESTSPGDQVYFLDFRGDFDERLAGPGTDVGRVLCAAAERGVGVFGLLWRSHPRAFHQSEEANAEFVRQIHDHGGEVLLDARTRRGGSHHQKLVVIRRPRSPERDIAFVGGIDLGHSRHDDREHHGDPQPMEFPAVYSERPPWHDIQVAVRGPAVHDLEHTFRERWYGSSVLDVPSPIRQLYDRAYHASAMTGEPLPEPTPDDPTRHGTHAVQVLRTYPARLRRYPFAPLGERSIAAAYRRTLPQARRLIYLEDHFFWSLEAARLIADALIADTGLHVIVVVPRYSDSDGRLALPSHLGRERAVALCQRAGGDRFGIYDVENHEGTAVYVHAKVVVVDDVWAMAGSDNLNRRSWTHDSELSVGVLDSRRDVREPVDPGGRGEGARQFARDLRLRLMCEHLDRSPGDTEDLIDPESGFRAIAESATRLERWHAAGRHGDRPPGRVRPHTTVRVSGIGRSWALLLYRFLFDPDGRAWRDKIRRRT